MQSIFSSRRTDYVIHLADFCRFSGPRQYEFTQDTLVFDVLDVPLVHGWIVDSSDPAKLVIDKCGSYNHLVEFIINSKHSPGEDFEVCLAKFTYRTE